jgi:hypothetical protein
MRNRLYHHAAAATALMLLLLTMLNPSAAHAAVAKAKAPSHPVQVFDVKAEKVVKTVDNDRHYQKYARSWLKSVTGFAPQLTADDSCLYVYRVPLNKPTKIKVSQTELNVREVFLFNCANKPPLLLVFDEQRRPYLLLFSADIAPFIKKIGIPS